MTRALYISPMSLSTNNGMLQRQLQTLDALCYVYQGRVDVLSLAASPSAMRVWLRSSGVNVQVLEGLYAWLARLNTTAWYVGNVIACNKLCWNDRFRFPVQTPLSRAWIERYDMILCYYPWAHRLLKLERAGRKVVVDLGDVMADRHNRTGARRWITLDDGDERAIIVSKSRCVAISSDDATEFERLYGKRLQVMPFVPANYPTLIALASTHRPRRVGFIGAPSYLNEEIARVLATSVFLEALSTAGVELIVAGGLCGTLDAATLARLKSGGARVIGQIDRLEDFYREVAAVLNPVGPSTGVKIKSVEALMAGRHLVTTRWGTDSLLRDAFKDQIVTVDWPIDSANLANAAIQAVKSSSGSNKAAANAYAERAQSVLRGVLAV